MNKFRVSLKLATFGFLLGAGVTASAATSAATIDFEGLARQTPITDQIAGVSIAATGGINLAWVYDTSPAGGDTQDPDLTGPHDGVGGSPYLRSTGNVLIVQEQPKRDNPRGDLQPDDNGDGGTLTLTFADTITMQGMDVFDMQAGSNGSTVSLFSETALIQTVVLLDTDTSGNQQGNNLYQHIDFGNVAGVKRVEVFMKGSGAIDNISYVPIPAAAWLFGSALLGLVAVGRRRPA